MQKSIIFSIFAGLTLTACGPVEEQELRRISELKETRAEPPYFQLKAGCRLPEMTYDQGLVQLKVSEALKARSPSKITLKSDPGGKYGRSGFWEDHTTPESDTIKNLKQLRLRERNLSKISNTAVREIVDSHCNQNSVYGGVISNWGPSLGVIPERLKSTFRVEDPSRIQNLDDADVPDKFDPLEALNKREPNSDEMYFGLIACFETKRVKRLYVVDLEILRPWFDPVDEPVCEPIDWSDFRDTPTTVMYIE